MLVNARMSVVARAAANE